MHSGDSLAYSYDALNRPVRRNSDAFGYNARSEVTAALVAGNSAEYDYDYIGNETRLAANCLNQYEQFPHDIDGNLLSDGNLSFTYDAANRLKTVTSNGVLLVTNFYDARSRRVKKVTPEATATFFYDDWNLIEKRVAYTNGRSSTIRYYWGKDLSGSFQGAGGVGGLLYLTVDGVPYVPTYDNNGNITRYLDSNGSTVASYTSDAFGGTIAASGPLAHVFRQRFSTKYFDAETGLCYYGYRFYSPTLMRWLNRDPIEEEEGLNQYVFCQNLPVALFDKHGMFPSSIKQCSKSGVAISFVFDGRTLSGSGFSATAASGRPQKSNAPSALIKNRFGRIVGTRATYNYKFDYGKERQRIKNVGPTPEGMYYILVSEKRTKRNSVRTLILQHAGWGDYGWSLHPEPKTETYGRSGFFMHGGSEWGSAGCIDLTSGDAILSTFLDGLCNCYIPVIVKYAVEENKISATYTDWIPE